MPCRDRKFFLLALIVCVALVCQAADQPVPGQNVNMVSGTGWPGGDPFLQRQNEPSIAVSTRNPQHLLAGANDYRTVDLNLLDPLPNDQLAGDAWLGVFKSFDGGRRWASTLFPGFPLDISPQGVNSPVHGFPAASDPVVRAGTNGMFYYTGIALNRSSNAGIVFAARFIDLNNKENGDVTALASSPTAGATASAASSAVTPAPTDPIRYLGTVKVDGGNAGQFIDKPWIAVDIPRTGAGTCTIQAKQSDGSIVTQTFPAGNVYMAYAMFVGGIVNVRSKINFTRSTDCGATWSKPILLSQTFAQNQGTQVAVDPQTGWVYVAWRVFAAANDPNQIVVAKSTDGGITFSKAVPVVTRSSYNPLNPAASAFFDQGTTGTSFRTIAMPAIAVDNSGRVYVAWSERGIGPFGEARIVMSSSADGVNGWTTPTPVDNGALADDVGGIFARGHQVMPAMTFIQGNLELLYYDLRLDHTIGFYLPNSPLFEPDKNHDGRLYTESRECAGELANCNDPNGMGLVFGPFIDDAGLTMRRHTMDVMLAQSSGGQNPTFSHARVSHYDFGIPSANAGQLQQLKQNPPNLPMFGMGQKPFIGDYLDVVGQMFVSDGNGGWKYNNPAQTLTANATSTSTSTSVYHATWTSNQDVIPPADGNWQHYNPIPLGPNSIYNGGQIDPCQAGFEASRNQNIYQSRVTQGLLLSSPQNSKPLSTTLQRAFVALAQNFTGEDKTFRFTIANQPPGNFSLATTPPSIGGYASFEQALPNQPALPNPLPAPVKAQDVAIPAHSGVATTVFALSSSLTATIIVNVNETDSLNGTLKKDGLSSFIVLNADPLNPALTNPDGAPPSTSISNVEIYTPNITTPNITTPNITTPNITTPNITTPNITTPNITTPNITTPNITTPNITTTNVANPNITTPNITTPNITTSTPADATYTVSNHSNTNATYHVHVTGNSPIPLQLIVSQVYTTPTSYQCQLIPQQQNITLANVERVQFANFSQILDPNITTPGVSDAIISLAPGESAFATLRGLFNTDRPAEAIEQMQAIVNGATPVVTADAVSTNTAGTIPIVVAPPTTALTILTDSFPLAKPNQQYSASIPVIGGTTPYQFAITSGSLPPGLELGGACGTGVICGVPTSTGAFSFTVQVSDSSEPVQSTSREFQIGVFLSPPGLTFITQPSDSQGSQAISPAVRVRATDTSGAVIPGLKISLGMGNAACPAAILSGTLSAATDEAGTASFGNLSVDRGGYGYTLAASALGTLVPSSPFDIGGFCATGEMSAFRTLPTATLLSDGTVLISGGLTLQTVTYLTSAETYDPATAKFTLTAGAMATPRYEHPGPLLPDGTVLLNGGTTPSITSASELYNPATRTFAATANMGAARTQHTGTLLASGKVLIAGAVPQALLYDPVTARFSDGGSMSTARTTHTATTLADGKVLIAGGNAGFTDFSSAEVYDPETTLFTTTAGNMTASRRLASAALLPRGQVLIAGGSSNGSPLTNADLYDPATRTFSATGAMNATHFWVPSTLLPNGKVLIAGPSATAELYDPSTGTWSLTGSMTVPRARHTATLLPNGTVLFTGGDDNSEVSYSTAELYLPVPRGANPIVANAVAVYGSPAARIRLFKDPALFATTFGTVEGESQNFDGIASGTPITSIIPGVLNLSSPFDTLEVRGGEIFGFDNHTRIAGQGQYELTFASPRNAIGFNIKAFDPVTTPAKVEVQTSAGNVMLLIGNPTNQETSPTFVGIVSSVAIRKVIVHEGFERSVPTGNEEITLDDFRVGTVPFPTY